MRKLTIIANSDNSIETKKQGVNDSEATFMLAAPLIAVCRKNGISEKRLNEIMSTLWVDGTIEEESE